MKNFKSAGRHSTYTQLAEKLSRELMKTGTVDRISPGEISAKRARSQRVSVRRDGKFSFTVTVVGGGIQKLFVICNKKDGDSMTKMLEMIEVWARKNHTNFSFRDTFSL